MCLNIYGDAVGVENAWYETSIISIISIIVAVIFAFYFVQRLTDERKLKSIVEDFAKKIQREISEKKYYDFAKYDTSNIELTMMQRNVGNLIKLIESVSKKVGVFDEIVFVETKFTEYKEIIGESYNDKEKRVGDARPLERLLAVINNKLDELIMKLYK